jgi:MFS family permease
MLIAIVAALAGVGAVLGILSGGEYKTLLISAAIVGGMSNPLYALLLAHTNDFLEYEDMAAASGGLLFINGLGAFLGPMVIGWLMGRFGPSAFFYVLATLLFAMGLYALFRMTRRAAIAVDDTTAYAPVLPTNTAVFVEAAQDYVYETALEEENEATDTDTSETK